jgi:hypothetical protein
MDRVAEVILDIRARAAVIHTSRIMARTAGITLRIMVHDVVMVVQRNLRIVEDRRVMVTWLNMTIMASNTARRMITTAASTMPIKGGQALDRTARSTPVAPRAVRRTTVRGQRIRANMAPKANMFSIVTAVVSSPARN